MMTRMARMITAPLKIKTLLANPRLLAQAPIKLTPKVRLKKTGEKC